MESPWWSQAETAGFSEQPSVLWNWHMDFMDFDIF